MLSQQQEQNEVQTEKWKEIGDTGWALAVFINLALCTSVLNGLNCHDPNHFSYHLLMFLCSYFISSSSSAPHVLLVWIRVCIWGTQIYFIWPIVFKYFLNVYNFRHECTFQFVIDPTTYQLTNLHLALFIHLFCVIGACKSWFTAKNLKAFCLLLAAVCVFLEKYIFQIVWHWNRNITADIYGSNEWSFPSISAQYNNTVSNEIVTIPWQSGHGTPVRYVCESI